MPATYKMIKDGLDNGYLVMTGNINAPISGMEKNDCGLPFIHSFSLSAAFTLKDASKKKHDLLMIRNPWSTTEYD